MQGNVAGTLQVEVEVEVEVEVGAGRSRHCLEQGCSSYGDADAASRCYAETSVETTEIYLHVAIGENGRVPTLGRVKIIKPQITQIHTDDNSRILMNPGDFQNQQRVGYSKSPHFRASYL